MLEGHSKLYLFERGVVDAVVFKRLCLSGSCCIFWTGEAECIYRSSTKSCAGYELGWEFVEAVNNSKMTFAGFVKTIQARYNRRKQNAESFMSVRVFIDWWFGWASHMKLDFRKSCDGCGDNPKMLACDGTMVGVGFRNAFVEPIETVHDPNVIATKLKRLDRCFITSKAENKPEFYQTLRTNLFEISQFYLREVDDLTELSSRSNLLVDNLPSPSLSLFSKMCSPNTPERERVSIAALFKQLSFDSSVDTIIPFVATDIIINFSLKCQSGQCTTAEVLDFAYRQHFFNSKVTDALTVSAQCSENGLPNNDLLELLLYLASFVKSVHALDVPTEAAQPIPLSYNPAKFGTAFYFTPNGLQLRTMRKFTIDGKSKTSSNYDDNPNEYCKKVYPQVRKNGMTFLFFWFCPAH